MTTDRDCMPVNVFLDLRESASSDGLAQTRGALERLAPGELLEVVIADPDALVDMGRFARREGHAVLLAAKEGEIFRMTIRCGGQAWGAAPREAPQSVGAAAGA